MPLFKLINRKKMLFFQIKRHSCYDDKLISIILLLNDCS